MAEATDPVLVESSLSLIDEATMALENAYAVPLDSEIRVFLAVAVRDQRDRIILLNTRRVLGQKVHEGIYRGRVVALRAGVKHLQERTADEILHLQIHPERKNR